MRLSLNLVFLLFACACQAGPLIAGIAVVAEIVGGAAAGAAVAGSTIAGVFGVTASAIWFGEFVVVNGLLFYGSAVAATGALAGGVAAGAVGAEVTDDAVKSSVLSKYNSAKSASMTLQAMGKKSPVGKTSSGQTSPGATVTTSAPPPSGPTANATVGPQYRNGSEIPPSVPEYNFRMCQNDIIAMGQKNISLLFDQPLNQSILVLNVPSTCMVLSTVIAGDPNLGPHPVPMGASSLQWNNVDVTAIDLIRQAFGQPPMFRKVKQQ